MVYRLWFIVYGLQFQVSGLEYVHVQQSCLMKEGRLV